MSATSTTETQQTATLKLGSTDDKAYLKKENYGEAGVHNIAQGEYEYAHIKPKFEDKHKERQWLLEHMAGVFRVFGRRGYNEGAAGHISVRDPVDPETFWINPLGRHFSLMRVSDLVHVDKEGKVIGGNKAAVNAAGFQIHSELHKARPDVHAACHTHSVYGKTYSTFGKELEMLNQDVCMFYKSHSVYTDFGGVVLEKEEGQRLAKALGNGKAIILQNHGLLTVGSTVDEAGYLFTLMERCCEVQLLADSVKGYEKKIIGDDEAAYTEHMTADPETLYSEFQPDYELELELTNGAFLK